jgi:glutathione S-transferase
MNESYQLFHSETCGFCHRVRGFLAEADVEIPLRDILRNREARRELIEGGGRAMVPCLRIERRDAVEWLYESLDIIAFLHSRQTKQISGGQS